MRYLRQHHGKPSQAPPPGFKGRRLRLSKGYLEPIEGIENPRDELRALARRLASEQRVFGAVQDALDITLFGKESGGECELDQR
jgi:hypothetical protein